MAGLYAGDIQEDDSIYQNGLDRISQPFLDSWAADAKDLWIHYPFSKMDDMGAQAWANYPGRRQQMIENQTGDTSTSMNLDFGDADRLMDPHALNQKYGQSLGLSFDQPTRQGAVDIMVRRKQEQIDLRAKVDHAPDTLVFSGLHLLTALAVGAADPINIASAFVPVVGELRAALWAERLGKPLARFAQGAVEGAAGQALLEPITAVSAATYQDHYGPMDAFLDVAFGGLLGGGLHTGFGAVSDMLGRLDSRTREGALRTAVAQMAEGRPTEIDHVIGTDAMFRRFDQMPVLADLPLAANEARLQAEHDQFGTQLAALPAGDSAARDRLARLQAVEDQLKTPDLPPEDRRALLDRRDEILTNTTPEKLQLGAQPFEDRRIIENQIDRLKKEIGAVQKQRLDLQVQDALTPPGARAAQAAAAKRFDLFSETVGPGARRQASTAVTSDIDAQSRLAIDRARSNTQDAARGQGPVIAGQPGSAAVAAREGRGDDLAAELQDAQSRIATYQAQGLLTEQEAAAGADAVKMANTRSKVADAAAVCLLLHP